MEGSKSRKVQCSRLIDVTKSQMINRFWVVQYVNMSREHCPLQCHERGATRSRKTKRELERVSRWNIMQFILG